MKIIVLAGGLSTERDVSLASAAGICRTLIEKGHDAFLLDVFLGLEHAPEHLEDVFTLPGHGLEIAKNISCEEPDLAAVKASRPDQSDCFLGPNVIELCRLADITFLGLHGGEGENSLPIVITEEIEQPFEWIVKFRYPRQSLATPDIWWRFAKTDRPDILPDRLTLRGDDILLLYR